MEKSDNTSKLSSISVTAVKVALAASITYLVVLALLHIIKPEVTPSWQTLSIYSRGDHGWIMRLNFCILGASHLALFMALKSQIKNIYGRIGLAALFIAGLGAILGGIFVSDPLNTPQAQLSTSGQWHGIGAGLAVWGAPIASLLVTLSLLRKNKAWAAVRKPLLWTIALPLVGLVLFMASAGSNGGHYGPGSTVGWMNRVVLLAIMIWQITIAHAALTLRKRAA